MNYLFDFNEYIADLLQDRTTKKEIERYIDACGNIEDDLKANRFWKEYLSKFEIPDVLMGNIKIPLNVKDKFDWHLLIALVAGSFSSNYHFSPSTEGVKLSIKVASGEKYVDKELSDLSVYQIYRLFEIYISETMNLQIIKNESWSDAKAVDNQRLLLLKQFLKKVEAVKSYYEEPEGILDDFLKDILDVEEEISVDKPKQQSQKEDLAELTIRTPFSKVHNCESIVIHDATLFQGVKFLKDVSKYEKFYEGLDKDVREMSFYKQYLSKISIEESFINKTLLPKGLENKYNWEVIIRLLIGSIAVQYYFVRKPKGFSLVFCLSGTLQKKYLEKISVQEIDILLEGHLKEFISLFSLKASQPTISKKIDSDFKFRKQLILRHQFEMLALRRKVSNKYFFSFEGLRNQISSGQPDLFIENLITKYEEATHSKFDDKNIESNVLWTHYLSSLGLPEDKVSLFYFNHQLEDKFDWFYFFPILFASQKFDYYVEELNDGYLELFIVSQDDKNIFRLNDYTVAMIYSLHAKLFLEHLGFFTEQCSYDENKNTVIFDKSIIAKNYDKLQSIYSLSMKSNMLETPIETDEEANKKSSKENTPKSSKNEETKKEEETDLSDIFKGATKDLDT